MKSTLLSIMTLSITFQFIAAFMSIRLVRLSGAFTAWVLMACGLFIMGARRAVALFHVLSGQSQGDMTVEVMGLSISLLMTCAIWMIGPLFLELRRSHQTLLARHTGLAESNRKLEDEAFERQRLEKELRDSNTLLQNTFASLNEAIFIVQTSSRIILDCNITVEKMFGYTRDEMIGVSTSCLHVTEEMSQQFGSEMLKSYEEKGYFETTFRMRRKDGSVFDSEHFVTPIRDDNGEIISHVCVVRDISIRKRLENQLIVLNLELEKGVIARTAELQRLNRELEDFCYAISHELRAPIARLEGFSRMMKEHAIQRDPTALLHCSDRIEAASERLRTVIDSLLMMNRLSRADLFSIPFNLSEMSQQIMAELLDGLGQPTVKVTIAPGIVVLGDRYMLEICMRNLLNNAVKFTSKNPDAAIELGQTSQSGAIVYYVKDNGAGFDMSFAAKLFQPFCRLHNENEFEGNGIGLAIAQRIIERHGGRIWAEAAPGRGATFFFTLADDGALCHAE